MSDMIPKSSLLVATHNPGKFGEIREVLEELPLKILSLNDLQIFDEVEETGATHEENALLKAQYFYNLTKLTTLGEDAGIYVDAFPGELGVQTRRFRDLHSASDEEWVKFFLKEMENVPDGKRGARFVCHAVLMFRGEPFYFKGETHGVMTRKLEAPIRPGIPLSSCFKPDGCDKVYAALTVEEKNRISHRGKAIVSVGDFLRPYLSETSR